MTQRKQPYEELPGKQWTLLGEAEFSFGTITDDLIYTWLVDTLRPLNLNAHFLEKILASARLASEWNITPADGQAPDHVHLLVFTPVQIPSPGQSWGFFRVEKKGDPSAENYDLAHAVAFYLYLEGK